MKLQFFNTWFTLTKHSTMMQVRFSWAYNLIYTFTKLILRMQIYFTLAMSLTLSQILPCACKSFWRHFTFIASPFKSAARVKAPQFSKRRQPLYSSLRWIDTMRCNIILMHTSEKNFFFLPPLTRESNVAHVCSNSQTYIVWVKMIHFSFG